MGAYPRLGKCQMPVAEFRISDFGFTDPTVVGCMSQERRAPNQKSEPSAARQPWEKAWPIPNYKFPVASSIISRRCEGCVQRHCASGSSEEMGSKKWNFLPGFTPGALKAETPVCRL